MACDINIIGCDISVIPCNIRVVPCDISIIPYSSVARVWCSVGGHGHLGDDTTAF